jgi:hypothetical protein
MILLTQDIGPFYTRCHNNRGMNVLLRERIRAGLTYSVGVIIGLGGLSLVATIPIKAAYETGIPPLRRIAVLLYQILAPVQWSWSWTPDFQPGDALDAMLNGPFLLGVSLVVIAAMIGKNARYGFSVIKEAERQTRIAGLRGKQPVHRPRQCGPRRDDSADRRSPNERGRVGT